MQTVSSPIWCLCVCRLVTLATRHNVLSSAGGDPADWAYQDFMPQPWQVLRLPQPPA